MTENIKDVKTLLEEKYEEWYTTSTDDYGGNVNWQALLVIEELYVEIFGQEEFDELVKVIRNGI